MKVFASFGFLLRKKFENYRKEAYFCRLKLSILYRKSINQKK